ncbi:MAG TPA: DUF2157 domain-containing protein [bacterium]|nr:DUF2157 domain-containing protein [bacterium]HOM25890.1 DUF2157 domain-containing protein [bacterium]
MINFEELKKEGERWVSEGLITEQQLEKILQIYIPEQKPSEDELRKNVTRLILIFASVFIGIAFFSFVASNWKYLSFLTKFFIIVICMLSSYISGWYFIEFKNLKRTGEALIYLGQLIFGSGIFLIGQHHHTPAYNWPLGFILWTIGTILLAFSTNIFSLFYFAIVLSIIPVIGFPFIIFDERIISQFFFTPLWIVLFMSFFLFISGFIIYKKGKKQGI